MFPKASWKSYKKSMKPDHETKIRSNLEQPPTSPQKEFLALENSFPDILNSTLEELNDHVTLVNTKLIA